MHMTAVPHQVLPNNDGCPGDTSLHTGETVQDTFLSYVCPEDLVIEKLEETLKELKTRRPDAKQPWRARILLVGSEVDDSGFIKLIEEQGALVCCDRFCFGSYPGRVEIELNDEEDALTQVCRHYVQNCQCPRMMNQEKVYGRKQ